VLRLPLYGEWKVHLILHFKRNAAMKKLVVLVMILTLSVFSIGCGGDDNGDGGDNGGTTESTD